MPLEGDRKREYQREWIRARRAEYLEGKSCKVCGSKDNLEVDHIDASTKEIRVSALWSMSKENPKRIKELAKCQVLCKPCHVAKTVSNKEVLNGNAHLKTKYSDELVLELYARYKNGERQTDLAKEIGVSRGRMWYLLHSRVVLRDE